jgi:Ser/Thr protein kinase RdoA (MazF antagonist)
VILSGSSAASIPSAEARQLLYRHYGITGEVRRLAGEKDDNFLVTTQGGERRVLKISHPGERMEAVQFQRGALRHMAAADPGLFIPTVIPAVNGAPELRAEMSDGSLRIVRLLNYLEGTLLHETAATPRQDRALGEFLARVGLALRGFAQPDPCTDHVWDLQRLPGTRAMMGDIADSALRNRVEHAYDDFERYAAGALGSLRAQAVHNDMNPYNVIVESRNTGVVKGIIDFGDMAHAPLACDAAVAAAYRWSLHEHPLAGAARFLQGYTQIRMLLEPELDVMLDLIRGRLAMTINVANWQALQMPDNRDYALRLQSELTRALEHLAPVSREEGRRILRAAVEERR